MGALANRMATSCVDGLASPRLVGGDIKKNGNSKLTANSLRNMLAQHVGSPRGGETPRQEAEKSTN